jgi:uncharacterized lipoprotein NlpE involved in copper resistance
MTPLLAFGCLLIIGLAVDAAGQAHAEQALRQSGAYCGRQAIADASTWARSAAAVVVEATQTCLTAAGLSGQVIAHGDQLLIELDSQTPTRLLNLIGINTLPCQATVQLSLTSGGGR